MESTEDGSWALVLPFDSDQPEFTRGFTCGQIWQLMELEEPVIEHTVTSDNLFMCTVMADKGGYELKAEELNTKASELEDTDWVSVSFTRKDLIKVDSDG